MKRLRQVRVALLIATGRDLGKFFAPVSEFRKSFTDLDKPRLPALPPSTTEQRRFGLKIMDKILQIIAENSLTDLVAVTKKLEFEVLRAQHQPTQVFRYFKLQNIKAMIRSLLGISIFSCLSFAACAQSQTSVGQVSLYHLNSSIQNRGACVQLSPALPQSPWACLWQSNSIYKEINALLLMAYATGRPCAFVFLDQKDSAGIWQIMSAECQ